MNKNSTHHIDDFAHNLHDLCVKFGFYPIGHLRVRKDDKWDESTFRIQISEVMDYGHAKDRCGPFIIMNIEPVLGETHEFSGAAKLTITDKDRLLKDGVKSQADGKTYTTRREYNDHLKRHDMVEVGDQAPTQASQEIRGDHDCQRELREAFKQHAG